MDYKKIVRTIISNKQTNVDQKINHVKQFVNPGEYKDALNTHPLFSKVLTRSPYFYKIEDVYLKEPFAFTNDFKKEFRWLSNLIDNHLEEINSFIFLKNRFEHDIVLGNYESALNVITNVEEKFGISLWSIESNLLYEDLANGTDYNWNKLSYYLNKIKNPIYEFVISNSSKRIEEKLNYDSFHNQFQNDIDSIKTSEFVKDFFVFKNFNHANYDYSSKNLESVLYVSNILSVVDQYLSLVDVIIYNISKNIELDKVIQNFIIKAKDVIKNDVRLKNIYNIINQNNNFDKIENSDEILECLDCYYSGDFKSSHEISKKLLETKPLEFELYETYCKSLINLNLDFSPVGISKIQDNILKETYDLLSFKKPDEKCFNNLLKFSIVFLNSQLGKQIFSLLSEVSGYTNNSYSIGVISSSFNSNKNIFFFEKRTSINNNFKDFLKLHCFKTYHYKLGKEEIFTNEISSSKVQELFIKSIHYFNSKKNVETIDLLSKIENSSLHFYYLEKKISLEFYSFLKVNLTKNALLLFFDIFFDETIITRKLDHIELFEKVKSEARESHLKNLIEYPILFSLVVKEYDLYEAYDDFLCYFEIYNIQELNIEDFINKFSLEKTVYFLHKVATIDTLKFSTDYASISDVEDDRVYLLNKLIQLDPSNKLIYEKEMEEIYRINSVRKVLKEVDEGRLFIDVNNLKELQIKKFSDDFRRFKEIEVSSTTKSLIAFNPSNRKNWDNALKEKSENDLMYNSAEYIAFKSIYLESRDNFLYSKEYGLDSCLSTRIRHGALKNHIRSVFEKLDLVTSIENKKYKENVVWKNSLYNNLEFNGQVQEILSKFSQQVDDFTIYIRDSLIQIQTEKNTEKRDGLFRYQTTDEVLFNYYSMQKEYMSSVESTIDLILTALVNETLLRIQKNISEIFRKEIFDYFQSFIDTAIKELRSLNLPHTYQLIPTLNKSRTDIQQELEYLSEWFYLNTTGPSTILNVKTILDASLQLTNRINPLYNLEPDIKIETEFSAYSNLIFVFNILLKNVIEHSNLKPNEIKLSIEIGVCENQKYAFLKFTNNLNPNFDYTSNINKLKIVKENWNNHANIDRSNKEGESGYDKIKRILIYEAMAKTDFFDFDFDNYKITIKLFFPFNKAEEDEENSNN